MDGGGVNVGIHQHPSWLLWRCWTVFFVIKKNEKIETGVSPLAPPVLNAAFLVVTRCDNTFHWLSLLKLKLDYFSTQGLNNIIHIDFDYKKEFIYWVDSTRPSGRKINRMRLNGSDLKVSPHLDAVSDGFWVFLPHTWQNTHLEWANDQQRRPQKTFCSIWLHVDKMKTILLILR